MRETGPASITPSGVPADHRGAGGSMSSSQPWPGWRSRTVRARGTVY